MRLNEQPRPNEDLGLVIDMSMSSTLGFVIDMSMSGSLVGYDPVGYDPVGYDPI